MTKPRQSIEEQNRKKALESCDANLGSIESIDLLVPSISGTSNHETRKTKPVSCSTLYPQKDPEPTFKVQAEKYTKSHCIVGALEKLVSSIKTILQTIL